MTQKARKRSLLKRRIWAQGHGGTKFQPADILKSFGELKRGPNVEIGFKNFFGIASMSSLLFGIVAICLIISQSAVFAGGPPDPEDITGAEWKWLQSLYNNDQKAVPADPAHYTITFKPDGTLNVRADCNRAGGAYTVTDQSISIQVTHSTMAMCPPDSLDVKFLKDLAAAAIYFFKDGHLHLDLKYDSGTMQFSP